MLAVTTLPRERSGGFEMRPKPEPLGVDRRPRGRSDTDRPVCQARRWAVSPTDMAAQPFSRRAAIRSDMAKASSWSLGHSLSLC